MIADTPSERRIPPHRCPHDKRAEATSVESPTAPASFDDVYAATLPFVRRVVRRFAMAQSDLDDAVQDVYLVAFRRWTRPESVHNVRAWLYAIAVRTCWNRRRARHRWLHRHECLDAHENRATLADAELTPDAALAQRQTLAWLTAAIARLDEKKRQTLLLTHVERRSAIEISRMTGLSPNTVASRLRAALRELRRALPDAPAPGLAPFSASPFGPKEERLT